MKDFDRFTKIYTVLDGLGRIFTNIAGPGTAAGKVPGKLIRGEHPVAVVVRGIELLVRAASYAAAAATAATAASGATSSTLPLPIPPGAQVTSPMGSSARDALDRRARKMRKRSAETPPDDPRLTGSGPESETVRRLPCGTKREAEDPPDDPRLVGGVA